jgi:hypothetical protein
LQATPTYFSGHQRILAEIMFRQPIVIVDLLKDPEHFREWVQFPPPRFKNPKLS